MKANELLEFLRLLGFTWEYFCSKTPELKHGLIYDYNVFDIANFIKKEHQDHLNNEIREAVDCAVDSAMTEAYRNR